MKVTCGSGFVFHAFKISLVSGDAMQKNGEWEKPMDCVDVVDNNTR